ncbi:MAG: zinc-dependent metalloprotease [Saprospiraceae bacterium]|nr:zinc-dependent metalloprotease [Saprospiraceae bacterium]
MKFFKIFVLVFVIAIGTSPTSDAQIFKKKPKKVEKKKEEKKDKMKPYDKVITKDAKTQEGLFKVHQVDESWYFELPTDLLEKEILVTSRVSGFVKGLNFGGAGVKSKPQQVIRWQKKGKQILLRSVSYNSVASFEDPIYESVRNNNFEPIIKTFEIKTMAKDSSSYVFDVGSLFTSDIPMISAMNSFQKKNFGIRGVDGKRSFIEDIKVFPENINVQHVLTYTGTKLPDNQITGTMSIEMTQSFILLPETPMQSRYYDPRVSYFSLSQTDYSADEQKAFRKRYITRWRLEPKDPEAYARGELVEPVKPIVYYIDPATPEKWRPYLKQGVNDWKVAFEAAGFKNAIMAKDAPTKEEDPDWSPEDIRYSVIRYVSTDIQNAMGPHVHDPRTGEILESDIIWYHNVMNLLRNWFFVQTAAINPDARSPKFKDEIMGRLIRFVSAHEVGHTLGLPHNMGSSVAYPVDSLRSPSFTKRMGTAPSIMDYARFNYVAQPGDGDVGLMPNIGPYDKWSINFGYRRFEGMDSPDAERKTLNDMIKEKAGDPVYRFGRQRFSPTDPTAQTEDLGDNSMKASELGLMNLKRIMPNLIEWTSEETKDFAELREIYNNVFGQYRRYVGHVISNVGGVYEYNKTSDEDDVVYTHVEKSKQKNAINFLNQHVFATPKWLIDKEILARIEETGITERIRGLQDRTLAQLMNPDRLNRMIENSAINTNGAYSINEMFDDLISSIYSEVRSNQPVSLYRRNLQRTFIEGLERTLEMESNRYEHSDMKAVARGKLKSLKSMLTTATRNDDMTTYHYDDLVDRIEEIFEKKS